MRPGHDLSFSISKMTPGHDLHEFAKAKTRTPHGRGEAQRGTAGRGGGARRRDGAGRDRGEAERRGGATRLGHDFSFSPLMNRRHPSWKILRKHRQGRPHLIQIEEHDELLETVG